jgi:hypothetical protein
VTVTDAETDEMVVSKTFSVCRNSKTFVGALPQPQITTLWLIRWDVGGGTHRNHYLAFQPTIELDDYLKWLGGLIRDVWSI